MSEVISLPAKQLDTLVEAMDRYNLYVIWPRLWEKQSARIRYLFYLILPLSLSLSFESNSAAEQRRGSYEIVFSSSNNSKISDKSSELLVMNFDGSNRKELIPGSNWEYPASSWSPDGRRIAYSWSPDGPGSFSATRKSFRPDIYSIDVNGSNKKRLTNDGTSIFPSWSPDGKFIAYLSARGSGRYQIYIMNADGSKSRLLKQLPQVALSPTWAPDGLQLAFVMLSENDVWNVHVINSDGSGLRKLTNYDDEPPMCDGCGASDPSWSPDGKSILYAKRSSGISSIVTLDTDSRIKRNLISNTYGPGEGGLHITPSWSPDGCQIIFASTRDGNLEIYTMENTGSNLQRITNSPESESYPKWRPWP